MALQRQKGAEDKRRRDYCDERQQERLEGLDRHTAVLPRTSISIAQCRSLRGRRHPCCIGLLHFCGALCSIWFVMLARYCRPVVPIAPSTSHLTLNLKGLSVLEISCPAESTWLPLLSLRGPL